MTNQLFGLSFGFVAVLLAMSPARAAGYCADRDTVLTRLASEFHESRRAIGLAANNGIVEFHASDVSGTWTITVTTPNGRTCLLASGDAYEALDEPLSQAPGKPT